MLLCGIRELKQWWSPPQAHVTAQNKGTAPACIGVDRFPWLLAWESLAGKAGRALGRAAVSALWAEWCWKGSGNRSNSAGSGLWAEIANLLPTWAGFLQRSNCHCWGAESTWSRPKALVIHLSERKSLKKMNGIGKQKTLAGEQPVTGI